MSAAPTWACAVCYRSREQIRLTDSTDPAYNESLMAITYHVEHAPPRKAIICRTCAQGITAGFACVARSLGKPAAPSKPPVKPA